MKKKGMSAVIGTLLLVMLTVVIAGVVWGVVNNLISKSTSSSNSCFNSFDKATIDKKYSCYNSSNLKVQFSLSVGDINLDGISVTISSVGSSKTFTIEGSASTVPYLTYYNGTTTVSVPKKNSGQTYLYNWTGSGDPDAIEIAPVIGGTTCPASDAITQLSDCNLFVG